MRHISLLLFFIFGGLSGSLLAQDYQTGLARYLQSEFANAEGIFQNLVSGELAKGERAKVLKLLGLTQYMQGKRTEAAESFKLAKRLSPGIQIESSEVLDQTVLDFFSSIEGPPVLAKDEEPAVPAKKKAKISEAPVEKTHAKATSLLIVSNAIEGRVVIDGFFRGRVGDIIPTDPGTRSIEVYADGYQNEVQSLEIEASRLNRFTFKLQKIPAKVAPTPETVIVVKEESKAQEHEKKALPKKRKKKKPARNPADLPQALYFIPFGVPQYLQGKAWTGLSFTLLQTVGFGFFVQRLIQLNQLTSDTNSKVSSRDAEEAQITDPTAKQAFAKATDDYYSSQLSDINSLRTQAYIGLGVFALSWLASGIEAYYNIPSLPAPKNGEIPRRVHNLYWTLRPSFTPFGGHKSYGLNLAIRF